MSRSRDVRAVVLAAVATLALGATGCAGQAPLPGVRGELIEPVATDLLGSRVLDLDVALEDVAETVASVERTYVDGLSVFSLRRRELLQATLQVSRLTGDADVTSPRFRLSVVNQLGGSAPRQARVGEHTVWLTTGTNQRVVIWFHDRWFFTLAMRQEYEQPRTLLRELVVRRP